MRDLSYITVFGIAALVGCGIAAGNQNVRAKRVLSLAYEPKWMAASAPKGLLAAGDEEKVEIYDTRTFRRTKVLADFDRAISAAQFSADGTALYLISRAATVYRYDTDTMALRTLAHVYYDQDDQVPPPPLVDDQSGELWVVFDEDLARTNVRTGKVSLTKIDAKERGGVFSGLVSSSSKYLLTVGTSAGEGSGSRIFWIDRVTMAADAVVSIEGEASSVCALANGDALVVSNDGTALAVNRSGRSRVLARNVEALPSSGEWVVDQKRERAYFGAMSVSAFDLRQGNLLWSRKASESYNMPVLDSDGDFLAYGEISRAVVKFPVRARGRE